MDTMKVVNLSTIRTEQYFRNVDKWGEGDDVCFICGRPMTPRDMEKGCYVHLLPNGDLTEATESDLNFIPDNCEMGWFQVGCTCYKNFRKACTEVPVKTWRIENDF